MYEHRTDPLLPKPLFIRRLVGHALLAGCVLAGSLLAGVAGYHFTEGLPWLDSLLNASMILGGMGPVDTRRTDGGKLFAGIVFLVTAGILIAPAAHRLLHRLHIDSPPR